MKVLIISYYWPPAGGSGVQRWLKFVKYLPKYGIKPIVYTVDNPSYPILDDSLVKEISKDITVLKGKIWEPNQLLSFFSKNKKQDSAGFLNDNPSFFSKIILYIRANMFVPDSRCFWVKPSVKYLKKYIKDNRIDTIITTGPPHSVHLIGLKLKKNLNVKWIADFRDPWTNIDYFHQLPFSKRTVKKHFKQEKEVLQTADSVIAIGETMKNEFSIFNDNVNIITNGYDMEASDNKNIVIDSKFTITHIGMMNKDRNHESFWKAIGFLLKEVEGFSEDLHIKLIGKVSKEVKVSITENSLGNNVEYIEYIPHQQVQLQQQQSQILLLNVNNVPNAKGILTGKIFEYLIAKRPILAIAPTDGDLASIIRNTKSGAVYGFEDIEGVKEQISKYYKLYKSGGLICKSENIEKYHRDNLTSELAKLIKNI